MMQSGMRLQTAWTTIHSSRIIQRSAINNHQHRFGAAGATSTSLASKFWIRSLSSRSSSSSTSSSASSLKLWQQAQAVCFDVDCTVTKQDALDDLAEFLGKGDEVRQLTNAAMNGDMDLEEALQKRLEIMAPTVHDLSSYIASKPAEGRLVPGIATLMKELQDRKVQVYLISGGFRELILPVADLLQIPRENIFANRFVYMMPDDTSRRISSSSNSSNAVQDATTQIRVTTFDRNEPTSREGGKPEAIRRIRAMKPLQTVVMVGDGITDLEAVQESGGADLFIGYGGVVERTKVKDHADWFIHDYDDLVNALPRLKVAMIGSGAFASAAMQMVSTNVRDKRLFQEEVDMYVYEEDFEGSKLTDRMNQDHENPKYLPGVHFGDNVMANPDLQDTVRDADVLIFCAPHQYMHSLCKQIQLMETKPTAVAISLSKGIHLGTEGPQLISDMVRRMLHMECSVMMGANLADEIGPGGLCEATIGSHVSEQGDMFRELFATPYFHVNIINDVEGVELAGALKNVVAVAAGFADGCQLGQNAKAAILRQGLSEMRSFAKQMFSTARDDTLFESCGVADLIATCYGGRNHLIAKTYAAEGGIRSFDELERDMLKGQKLQGPLTSHEVQRVLASRGWEDDYPLFTAVNAILRGGGVFEPKDIARYREIAAMPQARRLAPVAQDEQTSLLETHVGI